MMQEQIYDCFTGRYFTSSIEIIDCAVGVIRQRVDANEIVTINDFWRIIGLEPLDIGYCFVPSSSEEIDVEFAFEDGKVQMLVKGFVIDEDAIFGFRPTYKRNGAYWDECKGVIS